MYHKFYYNRGKNRPINGAQQVNKWRAAYYFSYNFLKFTNQYFVVIQCDVPFVYHEFDYKLQKSTLIVCTRWLDWRKKKVKQYRKIIVTQWTNMWGVACYFSYDFLKFSNQSSSFFHQMRCTSYHEFYYKLDNQSLSLVLGSWLEEKKIGQ